MPGARDEQRDVLQLAQQVRWDGRVADMQMKALAGENARIKRMYVEVSMQCDLLKDTLKKSDSGV